MAAWTSEVWICDVPLYTCICCVPVLQIITRKAVDRYHSSKQPIPYFTFQVEKAEDVEEDTIAPIYIKGTIDHFKIPCWSTGGETLLYWSVWSV